VFNQENLEELLSYQSNGSDVVSVYLDTDSGRQTAEAIKLQAKGLLKELPNGSEKEASVIERYLELSYDWSRPGLAIFSSDSGKFFRAYPSPVAFRNRVRLGTKPYIKPLTHLLDHYAHYGVVLVDRVGGRFYEYHLGELQATDGFMGEDVRKLKRGAGSSAVGMRGGGPGGSRHEEEVAQRNLRDCAEAASAFFARRAIRRLFIGGTNETVAQFREMLPKQLLSCLAGTFAIEMTANEHEVRQRTLDLLREVNSEREQKLVERMITLAAKGGNAVTGLDDTLEAVSHKRVDTLILSDGFRAPGYVHGESGIVIANLARSPLSDEELTEAADVIDEAVAQTMANGGYVEVISECPPLEEAGRIGAILRY
jgi:peptide subunit release factor 1 (eRF1)